MHKTLIMIICLFILPENSFGLQTLLKAESGQLLSRRFYKVPICSPIKKRFFSNTPFNEQIPVPEIKKEIPQVSSGDDIHDLPSDKEKFVDDMAKYDRNVLHDEAVKKKDWEKNLQEGWSDFAKAAKENHELSSDKFFGDRTKSDQSAKKEDRLEVIRDLAEKMIIKGIDPKDVSEITGLSDKDILDLKSKE
jgi:hypothetical protein